MAAATTKQKQLTPVQRAAAVVIALGADRASEVYRYLKDDEVEQISLEIAKLNRLSPEDMQSTIEAVSSMPRTSWKRPLARNRPPRIWTACPNPCGPVPLNPSARRITRTSG